MVFRRSPVPASDLDGAGGAYVRRPFDFGERKLAAGDTLTRNELATIPHANLRALVNTGKLELWPEAPESMFIAQKFTVPAGRGKYHVIEGRKITVKPISKEEAQAIARG
jgi:hypothetical protein